MIIWKEEGEGSALKL